MVILCEIINKGYPTVLFSNIFKDIFTDNPSATYVILLLSQK